MPLWYTSRSQYEDGTEHCARSRQLQYHSGPTGYGIRLKASSVPLATGTFIHEPLAAILRPLIDQPAEARPSDADVRTAIRDGFDAYDRVVDARGLRMHADDPGQQLLLREQQTLIEGLTWVWVLNTLPWLLERYVIRSVETEEEYVADCTCGLGDGNGGFAAHEGRDCAGIGLQGRADFITEYRAAAGSFSYHEFKTSGYIGARWETQWETKLQFAIGALAAERRLGHEIGENWVHGLYKDRRFQPAGFTHRIQGSFLVWAYCRPAHPPLTAEDWQPQWNWHDGTRNRVLGKAYRRRPIWEAAFPLPKGMSPVEYWVKSMTPEQRAGAMSLVGPLSPQRAVIEGFKDDVIGEERRWQTIAWELYERATEIGPGYWTDPRYHQLLNRLTPRSWACRRYGYEHRCEFEGLCFFKEGWERAFDSDGTYIARRPHHVAELQQATVRGLLPETDAQYDEADHD